MEQFERIRRDAREGASIRELARRHKVHRRTVRQALADATPPPRKPAEREAVAFGRYEPTVRGWLVADLEAPRKQRHTARRVWQRLVDEHGADLAESTVRPHVARLKVEVGLAKREVMVPQTHPEAEEAEVDFGQFEACCYPSRYLTMRASSSVAIGGCGNAPPVGEWRGVGGHVDAVAVIGDGVCYSLFSVIADWAAARSTMVLSAA